MSPLCPKFKLNTGAEIPALGLGTWKSQTNEVATAVEFALKVGYRHIDCAWAYGNEEEVGRGIRASGVSREEIFITSKLWSTFHSRVEEALDQTLTKLKVKYLDLYLVHWPVPLNPNGNDSFMPKLPDGTRDVDFSWDLKDTWKQMEAVFKKGKVKAIGVSNFSILKLEEILPTAEVVPAVDQLELHVYNPDHKLISYLKSKGIVPQAYSPLGSTDAPLLQDDVVRELAQKHDVPPEGILLGWHLAKGVVALPKSVTPARISSNYVSALDAFAKLDEADVQRLDGLAASGKQKRIIVLPWVIDLGLDNWHN